MSTGTSIEWTESTWNPTTGCDRVSKGCDHCYALTLAKRLKAMGSAKYQTDGDPNTSGPGFGVAVHPDSLDTPLRWRKPRRVFVDSMGDLFHDEVPDEFIAQVFVVMGLARRHTFQVLTKRHARMRSLLSGHDRWNNLLTEALARVVDHVDAPFPAVDVDRVNAWLQAREFPAAPLPPLPNVWLGVSVETQQWADIRIPALLDTPAAVRWLSCEPLLGPVNIWIATTPFDPARIDWVVAGGESGDDARPVNLGWVRGLRDECQQAEVPFLFKQVGGRTPKAGGRELDGRTWDQYPTTEAATA